jgi:hypothetical protein
MRVIFDPDNINLWQAPRSCCILPELLQARLRSMTFISMSAVSVAPMLYDAKVELAKLVGWSDEAAQCFAEKHVCQGFDERTGTMSAILPGQDSAITGMVTAVEWLADLKSAMAECMDVHELAKIYNAVTSRRDTPPSAPICGYTSCDNASSPSRLSIPAAPEQPGSPATNDTQQHNNSVELQQDSVECSAAAVRTSRARRTAPAPVVPKASRALGPMSVICKTSRTTLASAAGRPSRKASKPARYAC